MVSMEDIQALADRIVREFLPERIVLFGSYASGTASPDSDVDLLVVLPYQGKSWAKAAEIRGRVRAAVSARSLGADPSTGPGALGNGRRVSPGRFGSGNGGV